ncbi:unnamed protein product, partial [Gongylonema pulchrum]|uniref:PDZ domain-containing protein n=1 Tax=Gongylonema pulchrum TaxID=637853 RepID=A0A183DGR4_9BILA
MVLLSDGRGRGRPARLELTKDMLMIQITASGAFTESLKESTAEPGSAEESGLLYVGDAIVEINGQLTDGKTHDEVVQILRDTGD